MTALNFIGQLLVVQAKQMQDGGVQVVNVNRVLDRSISEFIRPAMTDAALHSAACKNHRVRLLVMVPPHVVRSASVAFALQHRRTPKLRTNHNQCFIQQPALSQVTDQCSHRPIQLSRLFWDATKNTAVVIPSLVKQLHKTHPLLDQSPRQQAVVRQTRCAQFGTVSL